MSRAVIDAPDDGYWFDRSTEGREILAALRRFREADDAFRRSLVRSMGMNVTDVQAIRHVIAADRDQQPLSPRELAGRLGISTASTTTLLDRLAAHGHIERIPHASDRRRIVVHATAYAHEQVRSHLATMHAEMARIAGEVPAHCRGAVVGFLHRMAEHVEDVTEHAGEEAVLGDG
ncbi:MarR family transcriptional regulator [Ruania suaedae]|uniref:MarR family winged helix-turn-helix transcriptional regulator n=1 Tax=Ruania suaedae TaxID=2897774 RepID=UPI001E564856|nr:MarR family transcriptional regulator [Ruania suaedae]UFU03287.1 MarR family transcriptional regulator [Ruania suaedae]